MEAVGLEPAAAMLEKYPSELSGGQRQRIGFAQALVLRPKLILADEPVSMLDVSLRVGILNLMADLREREDVSILSITHDLASARSIADRIIVMYAGHVVEVGPTEQLLNDPRHPYTKLLLSAVPDLQRSVDDSAGVDAGEPPKVVDPKPGCRFQPRCPFALEEGKTVTPQLGEVALGQLAACHVALADAPNESRRCVSRPRGRLSTKNSATRHVLDSLRHERRRQNDSKRRVKIGQLLGCQASEGRDERGPHEVVAATAQDSTFLSEPVLHGSTRCA